MTRRIPYTEILGDPNAAALLKEYSDECSIPEIGEVNPQPSIYEAMQASGAMQAFGVYHDDALTGFATVIVYVVPHYGQKVAAVESLFVEKGSRGGAELMDAIEEYAIAVGCKAVLYSAPAGGRLERLLDALKPYRRTNAVFTRQLQ